MKKYTYPATKALEKAMNTRKGIAELSRNSLLDELLKELDNDGSEIGGAMLELNALVNYVTQNEIVSEEIKTHLQFINNRLK